MSEAVATPAASRAAWKWMTLADVGKVITGNTPPTADAENYGDAIPFVKPTELVDRGIRSAPSGLAPQAMGKARVVPAGAVLVSCIGNLGKTGIAKVPVAFNQQINAVVFNENVIPEFGFYYAQTLKPWLYGESSATTIPIVNKGKFQQARFPLAPLDEQREIVAELEKQFSRLDEAVANLQRVKANLKRYKASVLSEFFDSKVSGWRKCQLKTVCQVISGFAFKSTDFSRDGVPVVKIANIGYGEFHWKDQEYLPSSFLESQRAFAIQPCDLLMALTRPITNGTLKVCLYPHDAPVALLNQRVAVLRVGVDLGREFLLLMMQSAAFKNQLQNALSETLQPNLSPVDLKNFEISIPSGPEQARIVAEVDRHLSIIREVEAEVDANLQRAQALRQSTLSSAFSPKP